MEQPRQNVSPFSNEARNTYVMEHITDSLIELLKSKELGDISISEICNHAGVGRTSFYRNFETKEDILRRYIGKMFDEIKANYEALGGTAVNELLRLIFFGFEKDRAFYALLNERGLVYLLKDHILGICGPLPEDEALVAYTKAFAAYTLYGWIEVWFQRGMRESAEEMAALFPGQNS